MILLFQKEVHMDKSEYHYLRGRGVKKAISVSVIHFFSLFLALLYNVLQTIMKTIGHWCLVKERKNLEVPWSKGWIALKRNPCLLSITNRRSFINRSHCSFVFAHIIHHFGRHHDRSGSFREFDSCSNAVASIAANLGEKLCPIVTIREKRTGKPWAESRTDKQAAAKSYKSCNANPMIFNAVKIVMEERINIIKARGKKGYTSSYIFFHCLRCLLDIGKCIREKTLEGWIDRVGLHKCWKLTTSTNEVRMWREFT